ncbi:MAG: T9SS type A sorting domain-containing protein [Paludibacteraceae bacterium]|nr:T9SS type A sorting domain-containing protein [Paludibacteraceae bacterium]
MKKITMTLCAIICAICAISAQNQPTGEFLNLFTEDVQPKAISENGEWACGASLIDQYFTNAVKWNLTTGETIYLQDDEKAQSDAYCISNDGTLVGGAYLNEPAYNLNGKWIALKSPWINLNGGTAVGEVVSITIKDGDTICLGWYYTQTEAVLARWVNGTPDDDFSDNEDSKYYYTKTRINDNQATFHQLKGVSNDGSRMLVTLDGIYVPSAGSQNYITTFVQNGEKVQIIDREFDERYEATSFVNNAIMSSNGKWVCGDIMAFGKMGTDAPAQTYIAFLYDVEKDTLITFNGLPSGKMTSATAVDNDGNVYFRSVNGSDPLCKPYIYKNNEYTELENCLLAYSGISAEAIDAIITDEAAGTDEDDLGHIWAVSADGNTLVGAGGATKSNIWCAKLSCSPYNVDPIVAIENVTYDNLAAYYANGMITLSGNAEKIDVYSITGAKVLTSAIENATIKANLNNGIYIVKIYNGNNIATSKIIVK